MRVRHQPDILSLIRMREIVRLDQPIGEDEETLGDLLPAPEDPEDPNVIVDEEMFAKLKTPLEKTIIVLRANGYTDESIGKIVDLPQKEVRVIVEGVRDRIREEMKRRQRFTYRVFDVRTGRMTFTTDATRLTSKRDVRVMKWTGYLDVNKQPVYMWDVVAAKDQKSVVTYWRNQIKQGYAPFDRSEQKVDWLSDSVVVGNIYQNKEYRGLVKKS